VRPGYDEETGEFRVAIGADGEIPEVFEDSGPTLQLTALTVLILGLMGCLLVLVGVQSIETERQFFQRLTLQTNGEIADLLSQQVVQGFSAATGLIEDVSRFPSVRRSLVPGAPRGATEQLLHIVVDRNPVLKAVALVDREGAARYRSVGVNAGTGTPYPEKWRQELLAGRKPSLLAPQYLAPSGDLRMGFASAVLPPSERGGPVGTVEAELSLSFLQKLVDSVQIGSTGRVLVTDRDRNIVFSSAGFRPDQVSDFQAHFPVARAFNTEGGGGGMVYGPPEDATRYLAAFRSVRSESWKGVEAEVVLSQATKMASIPTLGSTFTSTLRPDEVPDWMIVVQQDFEEGIALANRMRANVLLLVAIGVIGLLVIARLWWDSLPR
jgi:hypothetical protein